MVINLISDATGTINVHVRWIFLDTYAVHSINIHSLLLIIKHCKKETDEAVFEIGSWK